MISGFWPRVIASIIDGLLLFIVGSVCSLLIPDLLTQLGGWGPIIGFLVALAYFGILNSAIGKGQTIGKRLMDIQVVDRSDQYISLSRSLLRYTILGLPFFLGGSLIPPSVIVSPNMITSPINNIIDFIFLGFYGATVYLYVFNRQTRQSLHDLVVGTFVKEILSQQVYGSIWRPHMAVVGAWFVAVIGFSVATTDFSRQRLSPELLGVQHAIQASGQVHAATVNVVNSDYHPSSFYASAILKRRPQDESAAARSIAATILRNYPEILEKSAITIYIMHGFDIGVATRWKSHSATRSPREWQHLVHSSE